MTVFEFQKKYPVKADRVKALINISNKEIDEIINSCGTQQGKIYYSKFKKTIFSFRDGGSESNIQRTFPQNVSNTGIRTGEQILLA